MMKKCERGCPFWTPTAVPLGSFCALYDIENTSTWSLGSQRIFLRKTSYLLWPPTSSLKLDALSIFWMGKMRYAVHIYRYALHISKKSNLTSEASKNDSNAIKYPKTFKLLNKLLPKILRWNMFKVFLISVFWEKVMTSKKDMQCISIDMHCISPQTSS